MEIREAQERVDHWIQTVGVRYFNVLTNMVILSEEMGELARIMARKYGEQSFKSEVEKQASEQAMEEEMADVFFVLICLANQTGINLEDALERNLQKKTDRDSTRHRDNPKLDD